MRRIVSMTAADFAEEQLCKKRIEQQAVRRVLQQIESFYAYEEMDPGLDKLLSRISREEGLDAPVPQQCIMVSLPSADLSKLLAGELKLLFMTEFPVNYVPFTLIFADRAKAIGEVVITDCDVYGRDEKGDFVISDEQLAKASETRYHVQNYYRNRSVLYGWHLDRIKRYQKPINVSDFVNHGTSVEVRWTDLSMAEFLFVDII